MSGVQKERKTQIPCKRNRGEEEGGKRQQRASKKTTITKTRHLLKTLPILIIVQNVFRGREKNERPSTFILCRFMSSTEKEKEIFAL